MIKNILSIFNIFVRRYKSYTIVAFYISFHNVIFVPIGYLIASLFKGMIEDVPMLIIILYFPELISTINIYSLADDFEIGRYLLTTIIYSILLCIIGTRFLKKVVEEVIPLEGRRKYKLICYTIMFSVYFILGYINARFSPFINL